MSQEVGRVGVNPDRRIMSPGRHAHPRSRPWSGAKPPHMWVNMWPTYVECSWPPPSISAMLGREATRQRGTGPRQMKQRPVHVKTPADLNSLTGVWLPLLTVGFGSKLIKPKGRGRQSQVKGSLNKRAKFRPTAGWVCMAVRILPISMVRRVQQVVATLLVDEPSPWSPYPVVRRGRVPCAGRGQALGLARDSCRPVRSVRSLQRAGCVDTNWRTGGTASRLSPTRTTRALDPVSRRIKNDRRTNGRHNHLRAPQRSAGVRGAFLQ